MRAWAQAVRGIAILGIGVLTLVSCSSDPTGPSGPGSGPVTAAITPDGGTLATRAENGAAIRLTFPPGAVGRPVEITLRPGAPEEGAWFACALEPAYLIFFEEVLVEVTPPDDVSVDPTQSLWLGSLDDPVILPTRPGNGAVTTRIRSFGFIDADGEAEIPLGPLAAQQGGPGSNNLGGSSMSCTQHVQQAQTALDAFNADNRYENAVAAILAAAACLDRDECPQVDTWLQTATQVACDGLANAIDTANLFAVSDFEEFNQIVEPVFYWESLVERLDPDCAASANWIPTVDDKVDQFAILYDSRLGSLTAGDWAAFLDLRDEARRVFAAYGKLLVIGSPGASTLRNDAFLPQVQKLRETAYGFCASDGWHYPLSRLTGSGFFATRDIVGQAPNLTTGGLYADFSDDEIFEDLQYCATDLDLITRAASGGDVATDHVGGSAPGAMVRTASIDCPTRGTVNLEGTIGAFTCWPDVEGDTELVLSLDGTPFQTVERDSDADDFLPDVLELDIREALEQMGQSAKEGDVWTLRGLRRRTSDCPRPLWGENEFELFAVDLKMVGPKLEIEDNLPGQVQPGAVIPVDIRIQVIDQVDVPDYYEEVDVSVSVTGGSASPSSGVTDANGYFHTQVTVSSSLAPESASSPAAAVSLQITAEEDGVTKQKTSSTSTDLPVIIVTTQAELDQWAGVTVAKELRMGISGGGSDISDLSPLSQLTQVQEWFILRGTQVSSLAPLSNLKTLGGGQFGNTTIISDNPNLNSFAGLENLETMGALNLVMADGMQDFSGLTSLRTAYQFSLQIGSGFRDFGGLSSLESIQSSIMVNGIGVESSFQGFSGMPNLVHLGGLHVRNVNSGFSFSGLPDAITSLDESAGLTLTILTCHGITGISGWRITDVAGGVEVRGNQALEELGGLGLTHIGGSLKVDGHPLITQEDAEAWAAGITVDGNVTINEN